MVGVVPYLDKLGIDDEDSVSLQDLPSESVMRDIRIAVIQTPKILISRILTPCPVNRMSPCVLCSRETDRHA